MPSLKPERLWPLTARSVALAAIPWARKRRANCPRHSRNVAFRIIEPLPLLAHRLDDEVYVRMVLVRVQNQGVTMLEGKLFPREVPARG